MPIQKSKVTIFDVARASGVSSSAVSYALNGKSGVSDVTRDKVLKVARELGWKPNGAAQALATCPGLSRSGTTITAGCFLGFERKFAVRYSFILSIPAVLGANILSLKDALEGAVIWSEVPVYLAGVIVAAVVGYACIRLLKMIADKGKFGAFAYYCWAAGLLTVILKFVKG